MTEQDAKDVVDMMQEVGQKNIRRRASALLAGADNRSTVHACCYVVVPGGSPNLPEFSGLLCVP